MSALRCGGDIPRRSGDPSFRTWTGSRRCCRRTSQADVVQPAAYRTASLYLTRFLPLLLDRKDRMSMAVGLEVRVPFCDHRLVEYVFGTPWAYKTFDGREKSLLRAATADLLPESVVQRVKSPYPSTQDTGYEQVLRRRVAALLETAGPVSPLLDAEAVRERLATPVGANSGMATRMRFEQILALDAWLGDYGITVDV